MTTKTTEISTIRQRLIEEQEKITIVFFEAQSELKLLYTQGSLYQNKGINTDDDSKEVAGIVARINSKQNEIESQRMAYTTILDQHKKDWIEKQRLVTNETTELKKDLIQRNNFYLTEKENKAQKEREKIQKEKDRNIELVTLPDKIANCYKTALTSELSDIRSKMALSWARLTIDVFEDRIKILKSYNHKVTYDKVITYFNIIPEYLKPEEVESAIRAGFNYELFCEEFRTSFIEIKKIYLDRVDEKREELKNQSAKDLLKKEEEEQKNQDAIKGQEAIDKYKRDQALQVKTAEITIHQELVSQSKANTIKSTKGRTNWEAYIEGDVDWQKVMELYIESGGSVDFLLNFLKKDRPEVTGIKYKSSKSVINRL